MKWGLVFLSLVFGVAQSVNLVRWFERYSQASENAIAFESKRAEIARLDEVLTMSARLYASTGDQIWRSRYLSHVEPLGLELEAALAFAATDAAQRAIDQVKDSNDALISIEEMSLRLTEDDRLTNAFSLLTSPHYEQHKVSYQQGLNNALEISRNSLQSKIDSSRDWLLFTASLLAVSLLLLSELWRRLSIWEQREAAQQIEVLLERERRTTGLQRQFVSTLSHELRTPLAIISGRAQRLRRKAASLTPDQIETGGELICDAVTQLTDLMEGVLNVSRIEMGQIDVKREAFDPATMIEKVVADHREVNADRRIDVTLTDLPSSIFGDPRLLNHVVSNLVSNAVKYSDRSRPVHVEGAQRGDDVVITIHDEGVGIPKEEIDRLGERFFRASNSAGIAGTGIGLHFIKHLIDLHDGRLEVKSFEGIGSSFTVRLPQRRTVQFAPKTALSDVVSPDLAAA